MRLFVCFLVLHIASTLHAGRRRDTPLIEDPYITDDTYPDDDLTPGSVFENITARDVCRHQYARRTRKVDIPTKLQVKESYGLETDVYYNYSIDHLIPLSLGGTNDIDNLWPQKIARVYYGAKEKSLSDDYLHKLVCSGEMTLEDAQEIVRNDWVFVYRACCRMKKK